MMAKQTKHIDLNQFPCDKNGKILWKDSVGIIAEFFYNNKRHTIQILEYISRNRLLIKVDDKFIEEVAYSKIKNLTFRDLFYEPDYKYNVGDTVNDLLILEQITLDGKAYRCKCLKDGYEFNIREEHLTGHHGCPVCCNQVVVKGINDVATTCPHLLDFFANKEDACMYSYGSNQKILVKCPFCGLEKYMSINFLNKCGYVPCNRCSDGISYPNKFAHELFNQLSEQYQEYVAEYSPDWAGKYSYDNYIKLYNGEEIIVEMDGAFHCKKGHEDVIERDNEKDLLATSNNIVVIRIDCNYDKLPNRYALIKSNLINALKKYFDLSNVDWDACNNKGISNKLFDAIEYYKKHSDVSIREIAKHFYVTTETLRHYLRVGEKLGLCEYIRNDPNRMNKAKPVSMSDKNNNLIGIFKSTKHIEAMFPEKKLKSKSIRTFISRGTPYKGYIFKYVTCDEYRKYLQLTNID